jgi:type I restriction enzyme, S subunit
VPELWQESLVGECCRICNNLRFPLSTEQRTQMRGPYPYYGPTGPMDSLDHFRVEGRYALISEDGDHFLKYRDVPMTLLVEGKFSVNNHAHLVQGLPTCLTEWFHIFFLHRSLETYITRQGAGRYKLTKAALERLPILLPPVAEQEKIVAILSAWDSAISHLTALIAAKRKLKKGLMQQLLTGKRRFREFKEPWREVRLVDIAKINETTLSEDADPQYQIRYIDVSAVQTGHIEYPAETVAFAKAPSRARRVVRSGDILMSTVRPALLGIARVHSSSNHGDDFVASTGFAVISPGPSVNGAFIYQCLFSDEIQTQVTGCTTGSSFPAVSPSDVAGLTIRIPSSVAEQERIGGVLSAVDDAITSLRELQDRAKLQKRGLMQKLLTGQIRVKV